MDGLLSIGAIAAAVLLGAMTPGPSTLFIARTTFRGGKAQGIAAAVAMAVGVVIFGVCALVGLYAVLETVPSLYRLLQLLGGIYLIYLSLRIWRGAPHPPSLDMSRNSSSTNVLKAFAGGLGVQLSNPKTALVHAGIYSALLPQGLPAYWWFPLLSAVFVVEAMWYVVVAQLLSSESSRALYLRHQGLIDRLSATVMGAIGAKLVLTSRPGG